jgi:general secretion pathway protein M
MNESLRSWWKTRNQREQRLLLVMSGLLALVLVWLVVIRPLNDGLSDARERHNAAVLALADLRAQAAAIKQAQQGTTANLTVPIETMVGGAASDAGFTVTRIEPQGGNQVNLVIDAVKPQAFFGWVGQMESRGLIVDRLVATPNADQSLSVQVSFRARGN